MDNEPPSLKELEEKLNKAKEKLSDSGDNKQTSKKNSNALVDIISSIIAGLLVGYLIDDFFNCKPVFLIICLFLGFIAGLMNIYRNATKE